MKITKGQLKEHIRKVVRQQLREQNFQKGSLETKAISKIDMWLDTNDSKLWKQVEENAVVNIEFSIENRDEVQIPDEYDFYMEHFEDFWNQYLSDISPDLASAASKSPSVKKAFENKITEYFVSSGGLEDTYRGILDNYQDEYDQKETERSLMYDW